MKIGIADTTFARMDMGSIAERFVAQHPLGGHKVEVVRYTVPGFKDLAPEVKRLLTEDGCDIALALGWAGGAGLDERSAMIADAGLMLVKVLTGKHVLAAFVHVEEARDDAEKLASICVKRVEGHAEHALMLLHDRAALNKAAGTGRRQGEEDVGAILGAAPA
jgi:riboflavin synthase